MAFLRKEQRENKNIIAQMKSSFTGPFKRLFGLASKPNENPIVGVSQTTATSDPHSDTSIISNSSSTESGGYWSGDEDDEAVKVNMTEAEEAFYKALEKYTEVTRHTIDMKLK